MSDNIQDVVKSAIEGLQANLLATLENAMTNKMGMMQQELASQQKNLADAQIAKINELQLGDSHKFAKKGNEVQFKNLKKIGSKVEGAARLLQEIEVEDTRVAGALQNLNEGMGLLKHRQKMILLADRSEDGWAVVDEYERSELADDSDDEKRISRATARAAKKKKALRAKQVKRTFSQGPGISNAADNRPKAAKTAAPGACFVCGKSGHWARNCFQKMSINIDSNISPVGRLRDNFSFWSKICNNDYILRVIKYGYTIPFICIPKDTFICNNKSSCDNEIFVDNEIEKLLRKNCISELKSKPRVVNPLTVAVGKVGKLRLVLDCRHINDCIAKYQFRYEDYRVVEKLVHEYDFMITFDIKSAYHHIEIAEVHRPYLGFSWKSRYYHFNVLPFGIASASYIFTKVCRVLIAKWRSEGHKIVMYLDDGILIESDINRIKQSSYTIKSDLENSGFILATEKCIWEPQQSIEWLGYVWNTKENTIRVTDSRIEITERQLHEIYEQVLTGKCLIPARYLASLLGKIISMQFVIQNFCSIVTRHMYICLESRNNWYQNIKISSNAFYEIKFWLNNLSALNHKVLEIKKVKVNIVTDASDTGYGGFVESINNLSSEIDFIESNNVDSDTYDDLNYFETLCLNSSLGDIPLMRSVSDEITLVSRVSNEIPLG